MKNTVKTPTLDKLLPPGMDKDSVKNIAIGCIVCAVLFSLIFYLWYFSELRGLYEENIMGKSVIIQGAIMPDFAPMSKTSLTLFFLLSVCTPALAVYFYKYYYMGTKSIYTMRRLPQKGEILRRTLTFPAIMLCVILVSAFLLMLMEFAVYMLVTPEQCMSPNQWQKIWR